jgi:tetratricopeptide (TPR) repeat protein
MKSTKMIAAICLSAAIDLSACANIQVGQQVQAGRNALQTGRPNDAVVFLMAAAETDPGHRIPYRAGEGVLTYLGRAYYETGRNKDAQLTLEKAVTRDPDDHLARVYLGLTRLRDGEPDRGRKEVESGLKGIHETLEYLAADNVNGLFWDPAGTLRSDIAMALVAKPNNSRLIAAAERIAREFDEEIDEARRDEARTRSRSGGGGGE